MKVMDLYLSVAQLGFEESLEYEEGFVFAANRALLQVCALRPATRCYVINHMPLDNLIKDATFAPIFKTDELVFEATDAKAYYFEVCGYGKIFVEQLDAAASVWRTLDEFTFDTVEFTAFRGFIKESGEFVSGRVRLRFSGEFAYTLRNIAMYAHILREGEASIPAFGPYVAYDISSLVSDFLSLADPPIRVEEGFEYMNQHYDVDNGRVIHLPRDQKGVYKVVYNHRPRAIESENYAAEDESVIDLDEDLCALLPMLVAAYIWADDEPEKAQYYLTLYRERAADLESRIRNAKPVTIKSINGW